MQEHVCWSLHSDFPKKRLSFSQNSELLTFTYGSLVAQLIQDYEDDDEVNKQLEKMYAECHKTWDSLAFVLCNPLEASVEWMYL